MALLAVQSLPIEGGVRCHPPPRTSPCCCCGCRVAGRRRARGVPRVCVPPFGPRGGGHSADAGRWHAPWMRGWSCMGPCSSVLLFPRVIFCVSTPLLVQLRHPLGVTTTAPVPCSVRRTPPHPSASRRHPLCAYAPPGNQAAATPGAPARRRGAPPPSRPWPKRGGGASGVGVPRPPPGGSPPPARGVRPPTPSTRRVRHDANSTCSCHAPTLAAAGFAAHPAPAAEPHRTLAAGRPPPPPPPPLPPPADAAVWRAAPPPLQLTDRRGRVGGGARGVAVAAAPVPALVTNDEAVRASARAAARRGRSSQPPPWGGSGDRPPAGDGGTAAPPPLPPPSAAGASAKLAPVANVVTVDVDVRRRQGGMGEVTERCHPLPPPLTPPADASSLPSPPVGPTVALLERRLDGGDGVGGRLRSHPAPPPPPPRGGGSQRQHGGE